MKNTQQKPLDIVFKNVTKKYYLCANDLQRLLLVIAPWVKRRTLVSLDNINLEIRQGEKIALIGKNGAGKSTILKILTNAAVPTKGTVTVNRRMSMILNIGIGFEPDFIGMENVYIRGAILGYSRSEIKKHIDEIVSFSGIGEYINQELKRFSAGMVSKLDVSIILHLNPEILIIDEALAVGDIEFNNRVKNKINELSKKENLTLLLVSHNESTIKDLCDRAIIIHENKIYYDGDPDQALKTYHTLIGVKVCD